MFTTFWQNLTSSIYSPDFYASVLRGGHRDHRETKRGTKSFVVLFSVGAALVMMLAVYPMAIAVRDYMHSAPDVVRSVYPDTMVLTLMNGELSVAGVGEPLSLLPIGWGRQGESGGRGQGDGYEEWPTYFVYVDTKTPYSTEAHRIADAFVWVGKTEANVYPFEDEMSAAAESKPMIYAEWEGLEKDVPYAFTKTDVEKVATSLAARSGYAVPAILVPTFVLGWLVYMLGMLVFGVVGASLVQLLAWMAPHMFAAVAPNGVKFVPAMRGSIFAGVLPSIVMLVGWFTPVTLSYSMYLLSVVVIVFLNVRGMQSEKK